MFLGVFSDSNVQLELGVRRHLSEIRMDPRRLCEERLSVTCITTTLKQGVLRRLRNPRGTTFATGMSGVPDLPHVYTYLRIMLDGPLARLTPPNVRRSNEEAASAHLE